MNVCVGVGGCTCGEEEEVCVGMGGEEEEVCVGMGGGEGHVR